VGHRNGRASASAFGHEQPSTEVDSTLRRHRHVNFANHVRPPNGAFVIGAILAFSTSPHALTDGMNVAVDMRRLNGNKYQMTGRL
jgi:hypothetical protein